MKVTYYGREYTVGNMYTISVSNYRLRQNGDEVFPGYKRIKAKLVFGKYEDGEGYGDVHHLGFRFMYPRVWMGTKRYYYITMPDGLSDIVNGVARFA